MPDPKHRTMILYWDPRLIIRRVTDLNMHVKLCKQSIPFPCHQCDAEIDIEQLTEERYTIVIAIRVKLFHSLSLAAAVRHLKGAGFGALKEPRVSKL